MKKIGKLFVYLVLFLGSVLNAQVVVQAELQDAKIGLGQTTRLDVSVKSSGDIRMNEPEMPSLDGFKVQSTSQGNSISTRMFPGPNGMEYKTEKVTTFTYQLQAASLGKRQIGSFAIEIDGKVYKTEPIPVEIISEPVRGNNQSPLEQLFGEDDPFSQMDRLEEEMFNQILRQRGLTNPNVQRPGGGGAPEDTNPALLKEPAFRSTPANPNEAFFIQVEVDKLEAYEGEQIVVSWYLMTQGQLESLDRTKFPDLRGFWKEIIEEVPAIQFYQEIVNGVAYKKALLARHALFPLKAGDAVIDEFKIKSKVRMLARNLGMNLGKSYEYTKSSQRVKIKVKPIPTEGRPSDYSGAVGQFKISSYIDGEQPISNQPMKYKVKVEGFGNAKGIELPVINWPEGIEVFEVRNDTKFFKSGQSFKEFEIILIPRIAGDVILPSVQMSYFNTVTQKFETTVSAAIPITIRAGEANSGQTNSYQSPRESAQKQTQVLAPPGLITDRDGIRAYSIMERFVFWLLGFGVAIVFLIGYSYKTLGWGQKRKDVRKELEHRLNRIEKKLFQTQTKDPFIEMTNLFYFVLGSLSDQGSGAVDVRKLLDQIPASIRRVNEKEIVDVFDFFQTLAFAPDEVSAKLRNPESLKSYFERAKKVLVACVSGN